MNHQTNTWHLLVDIMEERGPCCVYTPARFDMALFHQAMSVGCCAYKLVRRDHRLAKTLNINHTIADACVNRIRAYNVGVQRVLSIL